MKSRERNSAEPEYKGAGEEYSVSEKRTEMPYEVLAEKKAVYEQRVFQSNQLLRQVQRSYSLAGAKVLFYMASKISSDDTEMPMLIFDLRELCVAVGWDLECRQNITEMRKLMMSLSDTSKSHFALNGASGWERPLPWLDCVLEKKGSTKIAARLNPALSRFYLQLRTKFTRLDAMVTNSLKGRHSICLYELAKEIEYRREDTISIAGIREMFSLTSDGYAKYSNIYQRALKPACDEVNAIADIHVEVQPIKRGRTCEAVKLTVTPNARSDYISDVAKWLEKIRPYQLSEEEVEKERELVAEMLTPNSPYLACSVSVRSTLETKEDANYTAIE